MGTELLLSELAGRIGARFSGGADAVVTGVGPIEEAGPGQVTFISNPRYARFARESKASAIISREAVEGAKPAFLIADNPYMAFARAMEIFHPAERLAPGVSPQSFVHPGARLGVEVTVSAFAAVGEGSSVGDRTVLHPGVSIGRNVEVGDDCLIYPNVTIYDGVKIGARAILHAGCVVGSDGFGFAPTPDGYRKIPQVGTVVMEDDVEIGANTTIDRATLGTTRIGRGTKLDNLIQVAHNVAIGRDTVMAAQSGIAGSTKIGSRVMVGGQSAIAGHIEIDDGIMVGGKTGVAESLRASDGRAFSGVPAMPHSTWLRMAVLLPKLPDLFRRVRKLEGEKKQGGE